MTGIQFITDEKNRKTAAIIDLKRHRALWEDIEDVLASRLRQHEKRIAIEEGEGRPQNDNEGLRRTASGRGGTEHQAARFSEDWEIVPKPRGVIVISATLRIGIMVWRVRNVLCQGVQLAPAASNTQN